MTITYRLVRTPALEPVVLNPAQELVAGHRRGALVVLGGPRTGKTTALIETSVRFLDEGGPQVLFLTGSRQARLDLRSRVGAQFPQFSSRLKVTTFYSLCQQVVQKFGSGSQIPSVLSAARQDTYVRQILTGQPDGAWPEQFSLARRTPQFAANVREAVAGCQRGGLTPADVLVRGVQAGRDDWVSLAEFYQEYLDILGMASVLDYSECLIRAQHLLGDDQVLAQVRPAGSLIVVDQIEDMDPAQEEIVFALASGGSPVILAANPDCQVYGFRGAKSRSAGQMLQRWSQEGIETSVVCLEQGYDVARQVEQACVELKRRIPLPAGIDVADLDRYRGLRPDREGEVTKLLFQDADAEPEQIAQILKRAHLREGLAYEEMAVLVRRQDQFSRYRLACEAADIPVAVSGDEIQLNRERIVAILLAGLRVVRDQVSCSPDDLAMIALSPLSDAGESADGDAGGTRAGDASDADDAAGGGAGDSGGAGDPGDADDSGGAGDGLSGQGAPFTSEPSLPGEADGLGRVLDAARAEMTGCVADVLWALWHGSGWQEILMNQVGQPEGMEANRALDAVIALFSLAYQFSDMSADKGIYALDEAVNSVQIPENLPRSSSWTSSAVRLTTAHRAKGRRWSLVVVAGVEEGIWPLAYTPPEILSVEGLLPTVDEREIIAAERRLLYTACASASQRLIVAAVDDEDRAPSVFFGQIDAETRVMGAGSPGEIWSVPALVGRLRQVAADESAHPGLRQAASDRLALLSHMAGVHGAHPSQWWGLGAYQSTEPGQDRALSETGAGHTGGNHRAGGTGVLADDSAMTAVSAGTSREAVRSGSENRCDPQVGADGYVTVSASQMEALFSCPRRWYLSRRMSAESPAGARTRIGSLIHNLVQDPQASLEQMTHSLRQAWEEVELPAAWMNGPELAEAEQALARYDSWRRARGRQVLASEMNVSFEIDLGGPVRVQGRIDRLESDAQSRVWVVDFKTGKRVPTKVEASGNVQMGVYQLALGSGACPGVDGAAIGGAELIYLRNEEKKGSSLPKVLVQDNLRESPHLSEEPRLPVWRGELADQTGDQWAYPTWVHHRIAVAARILRNGCFPALATSGCLGCAFVKGCPAAGRNGGAR